MGAAISAGPTNSVVIDKQGMYWMAGKVLTFVWSFFFMVPGCANTPFLSGRTVAKVMLSFNIDWAQNAEPFQGSSGSPYSSFRFMQDIMYVAHLVSVSLLSPES